MKTAISRRTMLRRLGVAGVLAVSWVEAAAEQGKGSDWPCFRGPMHNGVSLDKLRLLGGGPKQIWEARVTAGHASMAIAEGRLFTFGTRVDNLACLDAASGDVIWKKHLETH